MKKQIDDFLMSLTRTQAIVGSVIGTVLAVLIIALVAAIASGDC